MGKRPRKSLPPLALGDPTSPARAGHGHPVAELGNPSVPAGTPGAQLTMPMDSALAAEEALGAEQAQTMPSADLAAWLDAHGLPYRWTAP